jgi:hypothetical protein
MERAMTKENDIEYLSRRLEEERMRAEQAGDPTGYRAHTEFAREYERKLMKLIATAPTQTVNGRVPT